MVGVANHILATKPDHLGYNQFLGRKGVEMFFTGLIAKLFSHTAATSAEAAPTAAPAPTSDLQYGQLYTCTVTHLTEEGAWVRFGQEQTGLIPYPKWTYGGTAAKLQHTIQPQDQLQAIIVSVEGKNGYVILSKLKADKVAAWEELQPLAPGEKRPTTVRLLHPVTNKHKVILGLRVALSNGLPAFLPTPQLSPNLAPELQKYLGQVMPADIIRIDKKEKKINVSNKELSTQLGQLARNANQELTRAGLEKLEQGSVVTGTVTKIVNFGIFVQLPDNVLGLIHKNDLSWERKVNPHDVAQVGDQLAVYIKQLNPSKGKIQLSLKALQEDPWLAEVRSILPGTIISCQIERIYPFGAFARISPHVLGFIHISAIANQRIKINEVLSVGQQVRAKVLSVDCEKRKIELSIAQAKENN